MEPVSNAAATETEEEPAALEIERFEWTAPDRIELTGRWSGLRGRRFIRPTLILHAGTATRRLLASLDHKPWNPDDDGNWIAAFAWDGAPEKFDSAELHVGAGIELELPRPRMRPGKPSTRFRHRAVSRPVAPAEELELLRPRVSPPPPEVGQRSFVEGDPPSPAETDSTPGARTESTPSRDLDRIRAERDAALAELRAARAALEEERQAREQALAGARAEGREEAGPLLEQAAQLRAGVERQREMAFLERDDAFKERDDARASEATALEEKKRAVAARKDAERERNHALVERDRALKDRERAVEACLTAERERDRMRDERDQANRERDTILSLHERELPIHPPQPKFYPRENRSSAEIWAPRVVALGVLMLFAFVVLRLFSGV